MKELIKTTENQTRISSREIAELTGKRHNHVCRDLEKQFSELGVGQSRFGSSYLTPQKKEVA